MLRNVTVGLAVLLLLAAVAFYLLTIPQRLDAAAIAAPGSGVAARGERIFWAGGCASCHAAAGAKGADRLRLGGRALATPFGAFQAPNISPDKAQGIGSWSLADFANAMQRGVDPDGQHLYPAFPYTSYIKMTKGDVADLHAYLQTLPPVATASPETQLAFPLNIRRGIGLWKLFYLGDDRPVMAPKPGQSAAVAAGRYLVEGPGHCAQCHTARGLNGLGGLDTTSWLAGARNPEGKGRVPNITPHASGMADWSAKDIAEYLKTGFTPDFDSVGGAMVEVQENMARLSDDDRAAIAAYLKSIPAVPTATLGETEK
ncbi:MAG: hypothetical protein RL490_2514 [Pseudomonadota bacterium]